MVRLRRYRSFMKKKKQQQAKNNCKEATKQAVI